jgi:drug/metabolite transporter (DMT)-like permease
MVFWAPLGIWLGLEEVPRWGRTEWLLVAASALLHTLYFVVLLRGYRKADLTVVYPLARGSGPLLSSVLAIAFLGEQLTALGALGIAGVIGGVLWRASHDAAHRQRLHKGMAYGLLTGVFIASYTLVDGYAVKFVLISPILLDYVGNLLRMVLLLPPALRDRAATLRHWQAQWKYATFVGIISPVSYVLVLFAALLGGQLLGEGDRVARLVGAALIAVGVMALALG